MPCSLQLHQITPSTPAAAESRLPEPLATYHSHLIRPNQCTSTVIQPIEAPLHAVWSLLRLFDNPQAYEHFLKSCRVIHGHKRDKSWEKQRQKNLLAKKEAQKEDPKSDLPKKNPAAASTVMKKKTAKQRRAAQTGERSNELDRDYRLLKKLKKGSHR